MELSDELEEISGLEIINDTLLAAINDGGNDPIIYLISREGKLVKKVTVDNAKNKDWEDLTRDDKHLYIADIGNNECKRKKLKIYKVEIKELLQKSSVEAEKIEINYNDQVCYPPPKDSLYYDSEGIAYANDSLIIFTKTKASPWDGKSFIYKVPAKAGDYDLTKQKELFIGNKGWWADAITAVDIYDDKLYILTYDRMIIYSYKDLIKQEELKFGKLTQKESIVIFDERTIFVADEKHKILGGGNLYQIKR